MAEVGVKVNSCKDCDKYNLGIQIHDLFSWEHSHILIGYDKEAGEILLSEEQLMRIIQIVNPAQLPRKIRLVSQDQLFHRKKE